MYKKSTALLCCLISTLPSVSHAENASLEARVAKLEAMQNRLSNINIFGRLQFDKTMIARNLEDESLQNNSKLRSGTIGVKGSVSGDWKYKYEIDFASNSTSILDAYLAKDLGNSSSIKIGQFYEPFSLEAITSPNFTTFLEKTSITAFAPGRRVGIGYEKHFAHVNLYSGIFGDAISPDNSSDSDENASISVRLTNFGNLGSNTYHIGAAYRFMQPASESITYNFRPEASIETDGLSSAISTGAITDSNLVNQIGFELAYIKGPVSFQGEYIRSFIDRNGLGNENYDLKGYYGQISYFLTNDQRNYDIRSSTFSKITPTKDIGAFEIAYRYSEVDANSRDLRAGIMQNNTMALNWYASSNVKFMANYVIVNASAESIYGGNTDIFALRAQINF